jgi:Ni,Fe-hydrogenase III component G
MNIIEIIKNFPQINFVSQKADTIFATVDREDLAEVATKLVSDYGLALATLFGTDNRREN